MSIKSLIIFLPDHAPAQLCFYTSVWLLVKVTSKPHEVSKLSVMPQPAVQKKKKKIYGSTAARSGTAAHILLHKVWGSALPLIQLTRLY